MSRILPQHFGKYILMRKIAMGGMAEIFKAKVAGAEGFEKELVIKRILPHFTEDEAFVKMFIDEASITSKLQHSNIVQIFDFDVVDGTYYIAMEYIEGLDLKDVLERSIKVGEPMSVAQCVWIIMEVSKGLHYAHTKDYKGKPLNIVHRDVSPSNVMVAFNGEVKLMDFGIAKAAQRSTKTMAGAVKGKVAYMSPEQARGKALDGRSDLFALGTMLWEMLTGRRLFLAESDFETLTNVLKADAPPPSSLNPLVPKDLDPILLKAIEKNRDDRWPSVEAFNRELTRWYYSNVIDLEKEKLKPLMHRLFKEEIDELERLMEQERDGADPGELAFASEATSMMMAPAGDDGGAPSEQATRMDMGAFGGGPPAPPSQAQTRAMAAAAPPEEARTRAMPAVDTGTDHARYPYPPPPGPAPRKSRTGLYIVLVVLLLLGGGAAAFFATQGGATTNGNGPATLPATTPPVVERSSVLFKVTPASARLEVDGNVVGDELEVERGKSIRVVAQAEGYEPFEDLFRIDEPTRTIEIALEKQAEKVTLVIKPADPNASIFVNDKLLGTGTQPFESFVGKDLEIKAIPYGGGEAVIKKVTVTANMAPIEIHTPAKVIVSVEPAAATVTTSSGEVVLQESGVYAISGVQIGEEVEITVKAGGYRSTTEKLTISKGIENIAVKLDRAVDNRPGELFVNAFPWAEVYVDGKLVGRTPWRGSVTAGAHKVVLKMKDNSVTKSVRVAAGEKQNVTHDFR